MMTASERTADKNLPRASERGGEGGGERRGEGEEGAPEGMATKIYSNYHHYHQREATMVFCS